MELCVARSVLFETSIGREDVSKPEAVCLFRIAPTGEKNLRVLQLINSLDRAGAEIAVAKLSLELVKAGAQVSIAALAGGDPHLVDEGRASGVDVELLGERNIRSPICMWNLHRFLRRGKWDVLHAHLFPSQYWAALTAAKEM